MFDPLNRYVCEWNEDEIWGSEWPRYEFFMRWRFPAQLTPVDSTEN